MQHECSINAGWAESSPPSLRGVVGVSWSVVTQGRILKGKNLQNDLSTNHFSPLRQLPVLKPARPGLLKCVSAPSPASTSLWSEFPVCDPPQPAPRLFSGTLRSYPQDSEPCGHAGSLRSLRSSRAPPPPCVSVEVLFHPSGPRSHPSPSEGIPRAPPHGWSALGLSAAYLQTEERVIDLHTRSCSSLFVPFTNV